MSRAKETCARVDTTRIEARDKYNAILLKEWESISQSEDSVSGIVSVMHRLIDAEVEERGTVIFVDLSFLDSSLYASVCEKLRAEKYFCRNCGLGGQINVMISWDRKIASLE